MSQLKPQEVVRGRVIYKMAKSFAICIIWRNEQIRVKKI